MPTTEYKNAALLLMDIQPGIVERIADQERYLAQAQAAADLAYQSGLLVIHVVVGFRPDFPEVSTNNQSFSSLKAAAQTGLVNPTPSLKLSDTDIVVTKRRVSAFAGSDLEVILRAQRISHLTLGGIATSGVVLSTIREAADKDFKITVIADLCRDFDEQVHKVLTEKVFPKQATVLSFKQFTESFASRAA